MSPAMKGTRKVLSGVIRLQNSLVRPVNAFAKSDIHIGRSMSGDLFLDYQAHFLVAGGYVIHDPLLQALLNGVPARDVCAIDELHHAFGVTFEQFFVLVFVFIEKLVFMFLHETLLKCEVSLHA